MREMDHHSALTRITLFDTARGRNVTTFLQALYRAILHRPATRAQISDGIRANAADARVRLVKELFHSDDGLRHVVEPLYATLVGRCASQSEIAGGVTALRCGMSLDKLIASIAASDEYAASAARRHPQQKADVAMMIACYNDLLQRMPGDGEAAAAIKHLASGRRDAFVLSLLRCVEYRANFIDDLYQQLMHRDATPTEIQPWTQRGHRALDLQRARLNVLASDEFFYRWS